MAIILVEHRTPEPALYGALAAVVARNRRADAAHLPAGFQTTIYPDAVQQVTAAGSLVPSGLIWLERLAGLTVGSESSVYQLIENARARDVVVPINTNLDKQFRACAQLTEEARRAGLTLEHIRIRTDNGCYKLETAERELTQGTWFRDSFGRLTSNPETAKAPSTGSARVVLLGAESDHRDAYPAVLASLGDAADAAEISLDVSFVSPVGLGAKEAAELALEADGVVLPGGSAMENVPGQILVARETLASATPTLGLCLGMQTMTTAVVRHVLGSSLANLAEVDPAAPIKTFVSIVGDTGPVYRLGEQPICIADGSRLHAILGPSSTIRCNHRYKLNPDLVPLLRSAGLWVSATDPSGSISEGIELLEHPFFIGTQGHPELMSRDRAPHPLIKAFVDAAAAARINRKQPRV